MMTTHLNIIIDNEKNARIRNPTRCIIRGSKQTIALFKLETYRSNSRVKRDDRISEEGIFYREHGKISKDKINKTRNTHIMLDPGVCLIKQLTNKI